MATVKAFIHAQWNKYSEKFDYTVWQTDMTNCGYVLLDIKELNFESPPEKELKLMVVKSLLAKKEKIMADAYKESNEIQQEADELLALEFKPPAEMPADATAGVPTAGGDDDLPF